MPLQAGPVRLCAPCNPLGTPDLRFLPYTICLLLIAACSTGPVELSNESGDPVVSSEAAADVHPGDTNRGEEPKNKPLDATEQQDAALLINQLEEATNDDDRNVVIEKLVDLGPRYLGFYRDIDREEVALDMMFVIRRIERANNIKPDAVADDDPLGTGRTEGAGAMDGPKAPDYSHQPEDFDRAEVENFLAVRLSQAQGMLDSGRHQAARVIAEAAITLLPDSRLRAEFDIVISHAKGESQSDLLVAGTLTLEPEQLQYETNKKASVFKSPLLIRCFLKNVSKDEITLRLFEGEGKESILQLAVTYEQQDYSGNVMTQKGNVRLPIDAGARITLQPNESYEMTVPLESLASLDSDAPRKNALGAVEIDAALRVYGALDANGDTLNLRPIKFPIRTVHIYPSDFDLAGVKARPITGVRNALDKGDAQGLFMSAHLVGKSDRRSVGDLLVAEDFDNSTLAMQRSRLLALTVVFQTGKTWDIKRWRNWWDQNRLKQ